MFKWQRGSNSPSQSSNNDDVYFFSMHYYHISYIVTCPSGYCEPVNQLYSRSANLSANLFQMYENKNSIFLVAG